MARYRERSEPSKPLEIAQGIFSAIFAIGWIVLTVAAYKAFPASVGFAKLLLGLAIPIMTIGSACFAVVLFCVTSSIVITLLGGGALVGSAFIIKSIFSLFRRRERAESDVDKTTSVPPRSSERYQGSELPTRHTVLEDLQRADTERQTQPNRGTQYRNER